MAKNKEELLKYISDTFENPSYTPVSERKSITTLPTIGPYVSPAKRTYQTALKNLNEQKNTLTNQMKNRGIVTSNYTSDKLPTYQTVYSNALNDINFNKKYETLKNITPSKSSDIVNSKIASEYQKSDEYKNQFENVQKAKDILGYAQYNYDKDQVDNSDVSFFDKTLGTFARGSINFTEKGPKVRDGKGGYIELPTYNDLKTQQVQESYDDSFFGHVGKIMNGATYEVGRMVPSFVLNTVIPGVNLGDLPYYGSMFVDTLQEAKNDGYDDKQSLIYSTLSTALEYATGKALSGVTNVISGGEASELNKAIAKGLGHVMNNKGVINFLSHAGSEGAEEFIQEFLDKALRNLTLGENNNVFDGDTFSDAIYSAAVGAVTGGIASIGDNSLDIKTKKDYDAEIKEKEDIIKIPTKNDINEDISISDKIDKITNGINVDNNVNTDINNNISNINENLIQESENAITNLSEKRNNIKNSQEQAKMSEDINALKNQVSEINNNSSKINLPSVSYQYVPSENIKIDNLRKSASNYFDNSNKSKSFIDSIEKIVQDKNYNVVFDDTLKSSSSTRTVNGQITTNAAGDVEIKLNPNSSRSGEFLIMHEVTHAIETDTMKHLVLDYASKNAGFNSALQDLKQTYGTADVSSEVLADISGQLFGNQEFINSLSTEKPTIFRKIYNGIVSLLNKLTGNSNEKLFLADLESKWREAYRTQNNNISANSFMQSLDSKSKINYNKLPYNLIPYISADERKAKFLEYTTAEEFYELNYNTMNEAIAIGSKFALEAQAKGFNNYSFNDGKHVYFFDIIDKSNNSFRITNVYEIGDEYSDIAIKTKIRGNSKNSLGNSGYYPRLSFSNNSAIEERNSSNENVRIPTRKQEQRGINANRPAFEKNTTNSGRELDNSSFSFDDKGRELTRSQQEYFKDSKARDENGNLKVLYHGTPNDFTKFSYDKLGTNGTLLGKGFYLTDDINVAKAYANRDGNGKVMELYADIKKPLKWGEKSISKQQYKSFVESINETTNGTLFADYSGEYSEKGSTQYNSTLNDILMDYEYGGDDIDLVSGILNTTGMSWNKGYQILKDTTGYDGIIVTTDVYDSGEGNVYIPFQSNQIKNVDNTSPSSDEDIRKSINSSEWQKHLEKNYRSSGTQTKMSDIKVPTINDVKESKVSIPTKENIESSNNHVLDPIEISKLTKEDANTTPKLPPKKLEVGDGESHFYNNIKNKTNMLNEETKNRILSQEDIKYYKKVTNKESLDKAFKRLNYGGAREAYSWASRFTRDEKGKMKQQPTSVDTAEGFILLKQYQDVEDYDSAVVVAKTLKEIGTEAGQTIQAFNIMERLTPEGMVKYAQSELTDAYNQMVKNKSKEWIEKYREDFDLKPNEVKFIVDNMKEVSKMQDGYEKKVKLAEIQKLMTDKLPAKQGAKIKSWMRMSMLFNPKTQVRNVVGNALIVPLNHFSDLFSSYADKIVAKKTGVRTTGTTNVKALLDGMKRGAYEATNDYKKGINTKDMDGNRFEISDGKSFDDKKLIGRALNQTESLLNYIMDVGDRVFSEASFENSIRNQMVLNNTNEITKDMIDIAHAEALQRTWNDNNNYTRFVLNNRRWLNNMGLEAYGLGDVLIPFAKTPANLTKAIVDYSPAGVVNAFNKYQNMKNAIETGQFNSKMQHEFVQTLGKATAGTMLYIAGIALAKAKITSGKSDDDKDTANFLKNTLGISSYSIKIGNKSFTYGWAQPLAAPLSITANIVSSRKNKEQALAEGILSSLNTAGSILLEQSFLQSINDVLSDNSGVVSGLVNEILQLPSRAIPTFSKQIVDLTDKTQRTSYEYGKPLETALNSVKAKIPGLSKTLAPSVDTMGREVERYGGKNNLFNVFLNPGNVNTENVSNSAKEIYRLYQKTGDNSIMPRVAPYYINKSGEKIILDSKTKSEYQKVSGKIIEDNVQKLLKNDSYSKLNDTEKASVVKSIVDYSYNKAKESVLDISMSNTYNAVNKYVSNGGKVSDYYLNKNTTGTIYSDKSLDSSEKKEKISEALINSNLTDKELAYLYSEYYSSEDKLNDLITMNIPIKEYLKLNGQTFESDYNSNGKAVSGSKQSKVINYVNSLNLSVAQKAILIKTQYNSYNDYDNKIIDYVNKLDINSNEKKVLLKSIGFTNYNEDIVKYINSQNLSATEKEKKLKDLGFTIRNGRVYW